MRKRRRLANKMTIMVCAVLIAVSAFFYAPMEVRADVGNYVSVSSSVNADVYNLSGGYLGQGIKSISLYPDALDDVLYKVDLNVSTVVDTSIPLRLFGFNLFFNHKNVVYGLYGDGVDGSSYLNRHIYQRELTVFLKGSELKSLWVDSYYSYFAQNTGSFVSTIYVDYLVNSINALSVADTDEYENGYNAGYSAGETAGYGNGYSNGFADGEASVDTGAIYDEAFQAGKDSVDTQSYYDAGYQAGYQVAYSEGYESGYDVGYQSAMDRIENWGADTSDYPVLKQTISKQDISIGFNVSGVVPHIVSDFGLIDSLNFLINANHTYKFNVYASGLYYDCWQADYSDCSPYLVIGSSRFLLYPDTVDFYVPGCNMSSDLILEAVFYGSVMDENVGAGYVGTGCRSFTVSIYDMGPSGDTQNHIANQTDQLTNGFDDSQGNIVNNDLSTGLNEYQTAEDSLWATATTGLNDFTFFDFESVPAMITGMSFITSIMGSWFSHAGGASGVGIVLSILFSVMLVAMVLGLYRLYQSKGGKK